jgi:Tfp pilus assembly protein PilN
MREFISVRARVARRLEARARFLRFALGAARVAIVLALLGEAFMVAAIAKAVVRNWW